jgi:FAD/FMN-containing dehydrogenase
MTDLMNGRVGAMVEALPALRAAVRGRVLAPGDPDFEQSAHAWNVAVPQRPAAVVHVADAADVVAVVRVARECGAVVSAQPGGHGATPALDGTILVRTGALDEVWVDTDARVARVGAGVKWGTLLAELDGTGLIALAGSNPDVSVVGYLLGGGVSWFGRRYGVAARALRAVELVDGTGAHRWVTDVADPDLMWALRGGGGEFGIVTRVELDLQAEPELHGGKLMFPISAASAVLSAFAEVTRSAPDGLTAWTSLMHFPPIPELPEQLRGQSFAVVDVTWLGPAADGAALLAPVRSAATPVLDTVGPVSIGRLGEVAAEPTTPTPAIDWSTTVDRLDRGTIARLLDAVGDRDATALTSIQVRHLDAAFASPPDGPPAAIERVSSPYLVFAFGIPGRPDQVSGIRQSLADLGEAIAPDSTGRTPLTMLGAGQPLSAVHDEAVLARLRAVKGRVDPQGVIRGNHPLA